MDIVIRKNCSQFKLLLLLLFIDKYVNPGGEGKGIMGEVMGSLFYPETKFTL